MPDQLDDFLMSRVPTAERPLLGHTVLVVEDSRFACEAMRLLCLRSGARIRRADTLRSAARHLATYRPSVVVVDLGLPDGSGTDLIRELARAVPRVGVILATSGDDHMEAEAMEAGADGFLPKPIRTLAGFQKAVLDHVAPEARPAGPRAILNDEIDPDRLALRDDLAHAAEILSSPDDQALDYIAQFIGGVARSAADKPLETAAADLVATRASGGATAASVALVARIVQERLQSGIAV